METSEVGKDPKKIAVALSVLEPTPYEPRSSKEIWTNGRDYVSWGKNNDYPQYLWDIYEDCATLQSIINGCADFTFGNGIENNTGIHHENEFGDTISDVIEKIILDRWVFGGFALQVKFNKFGNVFGLAHIDLRKCRIDKSGKFIYVNDKWTSYGSNRYEPFHAFNPETGAHDGVQIFFYKGTRTRGIYPIADYKAALVSCETQIKTQLYNYNEIDNNFMSTGIINFNNGVPDDNTKKDIVQKIKHKYQGYGNAGEPIISWNDSKENATTFERMSTDDLPDRYFNVSNEARANIFISLRAHPQLFGMSVPTGFADIEYADAFNLFNETQILKKQGEIKRVLAKIFDRQDAIIFNEFKPNINGTSDAA